MPPPVPHPGPRPPALQFPFDQARTAAHAADRLAAALERSGATHRTAATSALAPDTPFRGRSADRFRAALTDQLELLGTLRDRLDASVAELDDAGRRARDAERERLQQQRAWAERMEAHRAWRDADHPGRR